ncbi:MAG: hypothetical protein ACP5SQ_07905 [Candidatus Saccharicenans sp.]
MPKPLYFLLTYFIPPEIHGHCLYSLHQQNWLPYSDLKINLIFKTILHPKISVEKPSLAASFYL